MKRICAIIISLALPWAAHCAEEDQLLSVLQSGYPVQEKAAACARLKWIGTARCVPVLAELLTDPKLSHSARYALESMPGPEAGNALREALVRASGSNEVGIINSLGVRGEITAVSDLGKLLADSDAEVAVAAAGALGHIGGLEARRALEDGWNESRANAVALHGAESDGLLACANRLLTNNDGRLALPIFQELYDREKTDGVRLAAFRGIILTSEKRGITLMVKAIAGTDGPSQGAALQLASKIGGPATTRALGNLLHKLPAPAQIAVLQALAQRGDRYAVSSVLDLLDSKDPDVRLAAITTLGELRDGSVAVRLARAAVTATGAEKAAARQALQDLFYGPVTKQLLDALPGAKPELQSEIILALGERGDSSAAPKLLELARDENGSIRSGSLQALSSLAGPAQVPDMVQLVVKATNDDTRSEAADALNSACQRIESQRQPLDVTSLVVAVQTGPIEARVALLGVCSGVSDPQIRQVLRETRGSGVDHVSVAALRALCNSQDVQLLPDILSIARGETKNTHFRILGVRGCVRLITQDQTGSLTVSQKIDTLKQLLNAIVDAEEKREGKSLVLSGLASVPDIQSLDMAASMLDDAEVKVEAAEAVVKIAKAVSVQHPQEAAAALKRVLAGPADTDLRKSAQAALKKIKPVE